MVVENTRCSLIGLLVVYVRGPNGGAYGIMAIIRNQCYHHLFPAGTYGCPAGRFYLALALPPRGRGRSAQTFQAVGGYGGRSTAGTAPDESRPDVPSVRRGALLDVRGSWTLPLMNPQSSPGPCFGTTLITYGNPSFLLVLPQPAGAPRKMRRTLWKTGIRWKRRKPDGVSHASIFPVLWST